jgi:plasmid stabilization system protein ParE
MPYIRWSERASLDLIRLYNFLAPKSQETAAKAADTIRTGVKRLGRHPEIGHVAKDALADIYDLVIEFGKSAYVVRYRYDGKRVLILGVRHGKEDRFRDLAE